MQHRGASFVLFDVPSKSGIESKKYRDFVKGLKQGGYRMIQESVYCKPLRNIKSYPYESTYINKISPEEGNVISFSMTACEIAKIETIRGDSCILPNILDEVIQI